MWGFLLVLMTLSQFAWASGGQLSQTSPTGFIIIGAILLILVVVILYSRQKRRFND